MCRIIMILLLVSCVGCQSTDSPISPPNDVAVTIVPNSPDVSIRWPAAQYTSQGLELGRADIEITGGAEVEPLALVTASYDHSDCFSAEEHWLPIHSLMKELEPGTYALKLRVADVYGRWGDWIKPVLLKKDW